MNSQTLLNKPQPKIRVVAKVSKIGSLVEVSTKARKSSTALRKVFEKGSYQKRTQLSVLKRYKRRLDSIQNQNDKNVSRKSKQKIKLPPIKKYLGSFFSAGTSNDPLKSIGALAAFNAFQKGAKGDILGALGPALVFSGIAFGPSLLRGGINLARKGKANSQSGASSGRVFLGPRGNRTVFGGITSRLGRVGSPTGTPGLRANIGLTARQFEAGAFRQTAGARAAFPVALPGTPSTAERLGGTAQNIANRFGAKGAGVAAEAATARAGGTLAAKAGGVGARAIPLLGTAFNIGLSAYRFSQGDAVGGILSALSAVPILGWAALGVDLAREFGFFDGTILGRKGQDKLQQKTEEQKKLVEKKEDGGRKLTFGKSLDRYEKNINKFEEFVKGFSGGMGMNLEQIRQTSASIEDLGGGSNPVSAAGYEFTQQSSFSQYLTGDVNAPKGTYDPSHGTSDNYHDHLAFKDRETALRAYNFLKSKGITVTELEGVDSSVTGPHSGSGSAHHRGLAFDVPGFQWGASGLIDDRHYKGSAKVRAFMNDFYNLETKPNQRQQSNESRNIVSYGNTLRKDVKDKLVDKGPISFQHNGETYNLYWTDMGPSIFKNKDPLGLTREYYDFSKKSNGTNVDANVGLQEAAIKKIESMYSNPTKSRSPNVPTSTPQLSRPAIPSRPIQQYLPYEQGYSSAQPTIVPYPVVQQSQPQMMQQESSVPSFMGGPSEQQVLNSFYKRVLLNTVA